MILPRSKQEISLLNRTFDVIEHKIKPDKVLFFRNQFAGVGFGKKLIRIFVYNIRIIYWSVIILNSYSQENKFMKQLDWHCLLVAKLNDCVIDDISIYEIYIQISGNFFKQTSYFLMTLIKHFLVCYENNCVFGIAGPCSRLWH